MAAGSRRQRIRSGHESLAGVARENPMTPGLFVEEDEPRRSVETPPQTKANILHTALWSYPFGVADGIESWHDLQSTHS